MIVVYRKMKVKLLKICNMTITCKIMNDRINSDNTNAILNALKLKIHMLLKKAWVKQIQQWKKILFANV